MRLIPKSRCPLLMSSSESSSDNPLDFPYSNPPTHSLHGNFLDNGDVLDLVLERGDREVFSGGVPEGVKENVTFFCGRLWGFEWQKFFDDCGVWQSKKNSTKTVDFLLTNSGSLEVLYKKNQLLCRIVKKQYIPLSPQPSSSEIVRMKRYYSVSATNSNFKRRVSWFENIPGQSDISHIKIFEYLGQWPGNSIHGNSKNTAQPYKRTTVPQKQVIEEGVRNGKKPIQIIGNVNKIDPENPIDIKVIRNAKYNFDKKQKPNHSSQQNTADDIQILISQLQSNDFIQSIVANNDNKPPNIICYSEEQMLDLKSCMQNGSIIGIDRTFNLGACYVTCMVYQNPKLLRKGQDVSPVLLGPVFFALGRLLCNILHIFVKNQGFSRF